MSNLSNKKIFRAGILGAGYVASYHLRALRALDSVEVVGIADPDTPKARELAEKFSVPGVFGGLEELMSARPDVVHILTPPQFHSALAIQAMKMGCHVFVEKPMAETVEECDRMIDTARETGRVLSINHSARMDPIVLEALKLLREGACGDVLTVDFFRNSDYPPYRGGPIPAPYRNGSYPFQDLGVHGLYLIEAFLGQIRDIDVRCYSTGRDPNLFFDEWRTVVNCEKGAGQMYISWNSRPMQNELIIHGTRGVMRVDGYLQMITTQRVFPAPKPVQRIFGELLSALATLYRVTMSTLKFATGRLLPNPGIQVSVREFYHALSHGEAPPVSPEEGRRVIASMKEATRRADEAKLRAFELPPSQIRPRILVTGGTGFLGGALLKRLRKRGEPIRVLVRRLSPALAADPNVEVVYGDLGNPEAVNRAVEGIDVVYHVGAAMKGAKEDFECGTIFGTKNMVAACLRHGVKKLVYVSSITVLDSAGHRPGEPITERYSLEPKAAQRGIYTQVKLEAEEIVRAAIRDHGLAAVILRPGQIYGPGGEKFSPAGSIAFGSRWIVVGAGNLALPLVHLEDVVDAILLAGERDEALGETVNLVNPEVVTQKEYLEKVILGPGCKVRVSYVPGFVLKLAALGCEIMSRVLGRSLPLSRYRLSSSRPLTPFDCTAAREKLGWEPRIGIRDAVEDRQPASTAAVTV